MAVPDPATVTIDANEGLVAELLHDLFLEPRERILKWSKLTNQTAQVRIAYPGQHLASLVTGVPGSGTAARGEDLADGSEVKSCSRADQLGICKVCDGRVLPYQESCPWCDSSSLDRKTDSHWILSIKSESELHQYLDAKRVVFVMFDRLEDLVTLRVRIWEVWVQESRHQYFRWFVEDYWENNYLAKQAAGRAAAPLNLHPLKFDFLMMNPVEVFRAVMAPDASGVYMTDVQKWIGPLVDRASLSAEPMPFAALKAAQRTAVLLDMNDEEYCEAIGGSLRAEQVRSMRENVVSFRLLGDKVSIVPEGVRLRVAKPTKLTKTAAAPYRRRGGAR